MFRSVPRQDPRAYRRITASFELNHPLPPGPLEVLVNGSLEVLTAWPGSTGNGQVQLDMGVEERISVARNVRYHEESAGLFGGSRQVQTTVTVDIASALATEARIELIERIPTAGNSGIDVTPTLAEPDTTPWEPAPGQPLLKNVVVQQLIVPPGASAQAQLGYATTLSAKDEVIGGERRG